MRPSKPVLPPFWSLVDAYGEELLAYARRLSHDDGEDVVQEAMLRALRSYPRLQHGDHLRAWLYRITTTTAFDLAARKHKEVPLGKVPDPSGHEVQPDFGFEALVAPLPSRAREAITLRFVHDLSFEDIARRLECSPEAARQRVSTAVRKLRKELA